MRVLDVTEVVDKLPKSLTTWLLSFAVVVGVFLGGYSVSAQIALNGKAAVQRHETHDEVHELTAAVLNLTRVVAANTAQVNENRLDQKVLREQIMAAQLRLATVLARIEAGLDI